MSYSIKEAIKLIDSISSPSDRRASLPDDRLICVYETATGFTFSEDYKQFLKNISNAFVGYISPLVLNVDMKEEYGELRFALKQARELGVPHDWLPICEDNGNYYCITPDGKIRYWDHNGATTEEWSNLAVWVKEVWAEGG